ncbi:HNH endonuclease [Candidatus Jidaibacter acanthamoebae]
MIELVPFDLHDAIKHTGGASKLRHEPSKGV